MLDQVPIEPQRRALLRRLLRRAATTNHRLFQLRFGQRPLDRGIRANQLAGFDVNQPAVGVTLDRRPDFRA